MPKAPRAPAKAKHDPLHVQLGEDEARAKYGRVSQPGRRKRSKTNEDEEESGEVSPRVLACLPLEHAHADPQMSIGYP